MTPSCDEHVSSNSLTNTVHRGRPRAGDLHEMRIENKSKSYLNTFRKKKKSIRRLLLNSTTTYRVFRSNRIFHSRPYCSRAKTLKATLYYTAVELDSRDTTRMLFHPVVMIFFLQSRFRWIRHGIPVSVSHRESHYSFRYLKNKIKIIITFQSLIS